MPFLPFCNLVTCDVQKTASGNINQTDCCISFFKAGWLGGEGGDICVKYGDRTVVILCVCVCVSVCVCVCIHVCVCCMH